MTRTAKIRWEESAPWITPALVRAARGLLGWSQKELAAKAAVPLSAVVSFERGVRDPDPAARLQIVFAFSRAKVKFCRGTETKRREYGVQFLGVPRSFHR